MSAGTVALEVFKRVIKWLPVIDALDDLFDGDPKKALAELAKQRKAKRAARDKRMGR